MPIPPENVPLGLTAQQYERLHILYSLMQRADKALEAMKYAQEARAKDKPDNSEEENKQKLQLELGQRLAVNFMKILQDSQKLASVPQEEQQQKITEQLLQGLGDAECAGIPKDQLEQMAKQLAALLNTAQQQQEVPPRDVPQGLTAQEYYDLGLRYKAAGWTEQSRDSLTYAIELDPDGKTGKLARHYLRIRIPRHPVPLSAEQKNVTGFNQMFSGDLKGASTTFGELIRDYPDFEWPYGNLGSLHIRNGDLDLAVSTLSKALEINPYYVNAHLHLCRAQILLSDLEGARETLKRVEDADPDEAAVETLSKHLDSVASWENETNP